MSPDKSTVPDPNELVIERKDQVDAQLSSDDDKIVAAKTALKEWFDTNKKETIAVTRAELDAFRKEIQATSDTDVGGKVDNWATAEAHEKILANTFGFSPKLDLGERTNSLREKFLNIDSGSIDIIKKEIVEKPDDLNHVLSVFDRVTVKENSGSKKWILAPAAAAATTAGATEKGKDDFQPTEWKFKEGGTFSKIFGMLSSLPGFAMIGSMLEKMVPFLQKLGLAKNSFEKKVEQDYANDVFRNLCGEGTLYGMFSWLPNVKKEIKLGDHLPKEYSKAMINLIKQLGGNDMKKGSKTLRAQLHAMKVDGKNFKEYMESKLTAALTESPDEEFKFEENFKGFITEASKDQNYQSFAGNILNFYKEPAPAAPPPPPPNPQQQTAAPQAAKAPGAGQAAPPQAGSNPAGGTAPAASAK